MEHLSHKEKIAIMIAIIAAMFFAAVNQTIVGNALPKIVSELGGLDYYSWVFTIYMLTSSITTILAGKLSDIYGRKPFIIIGIIIFSIGALLAGTSKDIFQLIAYRGFQGLGAGLIMSAAFTAVGDLFAPRERGKWQGAMSAVFGVSSVFGPTLGGYIVDNLEWKWVFWVFLPLGIVALVLISKLYPSKQKSQGEKVDYIGSLFLTSTIVFTLLGFSWAGTKYDWDSTQIIGLFGAAIVSLMIFIFVERKATSPILPLFLFKNGIFTISNVIGFVIGVSMFGGVMYVPYFIQGVLGYSATHSSFLTMSMTLGLVFASAIGGQIITKTGKYKIQAIIGLCISTLGLFLLSTMDKETSQYLLVFYMVLVGFGLGIGMTVFTLTVQNAVDQKYLGVATASSQLFRSVGGTVGVAIMGTVLNSRMKEKMIELTQHAKSSNAAVPPEVAGKLEALKNPQLLLNHEKLHEIKATLPAEIVPLFDKMFAFLQDALTFALSGVFIFVTFTMLVAVVLTFFLKEVPLRSAAERVAKSKVS
ncbi:MULTISPECIES: MDR family MFS transporter [unclassified Bacillus (in: firmicutes)]|uniref:MDR family MFS transporter n=1 Tax=unclassified Bacillus (in: firmicutes) TaxID=185979 RepID=UPI0008E0B4BA|nr:MULTISPECIES: MDR family MFS transporter [unclassified Bacillus (in: firmicutes)]SFB06611.1 drug resistance transporter, EmrB/QacA subfamily [Bacillus sp. UNCCL13]SFQ87631.1 drug resistance transporter, EmrB/QacA subfamily [Bacillus sp. cl95]